ncbi:hypothetical protein OS42_27460 [Dickeya oryzae]
MWKSTICSTSWTLSMPTSKKLVKQIEVAGIEVTDGHNKAYIKLLSVNNKKKPDQCQNRD